MLSDVIRANAAALTACESGQWSDAVDALLSDTTRLENHELRTTRWLIVNLPDQAQGQPAGTTEADVVLATLQGSNHPRVRAAYDSMSAVGIDLADPQVQAMIPRLAQGGGWPSELADRVMQAGIRTISVAESITGEVPTEVAVQAAYGQIVVEDLNSEVATGMNESVNPAISSGDRAAVVAALRALADSVEA